MTLHRIIDAVALAYNVPPGLLRSESQEMRYVRARHVACYVARQHKFSLPQIGRALGGRHHTTIWAAVRRVKRQLRSNPGLETLVRKLVRQTAGGIDCTGDKAAWLPEDFGKGAAA